MIMQMLPMTVFRGENPALRQAYVRLLIDQVVVEDDQIHIRGMRKALEQAVIATAAGTRTGLPSLHENGAPSMIMMGTHLTGKFPCR